MKKYLPALAILVFAACGLFFLKNKEKSASSSLKIPGGASGENREIRTEWQRMRLADPATGKIPNGIAFLERQFAKGIPMAADERSGADWTARGPWNVGGRTRSLAIDVTNENHILAGGVSGGIWLSEDGGQTWQRKTPLNAHPGCVSIAQDTRLGHTDTWYYLAGELYGTSASAPGAFYLGDGMFKSTDGGNTWAPLGATDNGAPFEFSDVWQGGWRVVTSPTDTQDVVYAATYSTIWRSVNGGNTWSAVIGGLAVEPFSYFTDVAITSSGVLYATCSSEGARKGIWRSTNGINWTNIIPANFPLEYDRVVIGINPNNENEVYFLGATPGFGHYSQFIGGDDWSSLWKYNYLSGDGSGAGGTWEDRSLNLPNTGTEFDRFACQGGYNLVVKVQPGTNHVFIGGTSAYRSTDGFATPNNTTHIAGYKPGTTLPFFELYPNHHPDIHDFLFLPSNSNVMFSGSDGGLHRTNDANAPTVAWTSLNRGYQTTQFYAATIDKNASGDPTIIGGFQDNGNFFVNSDNPTAFWKQTINGDGSYGAIANNKDFYIVSAQSNGVKVVKCNIDASGNVTAFQRIDPIGPTRDDYLFINPLALDPSDNNVLYLPAGNRFYRQGNLGSIQLNNQWDSISTGWTVFPDTLTTLPGTEHVFSAVTVSQSNPTHRVYLGSSRNKIYRVDNAHIGAPSFTTITPPIGTSTAYVNCIAVDPENADRIILVYSNYNIYSIFLSENAGQNWKKVGGNLEATVAGTGNAPSIRWVSILPFSNGKKKYLCGTSVGLYSADTLLLHATGQAGTQWVLEGPGVIGSAVVDFVDSRVSDGLVVAATHGNGLFSANFTPPSSSNEPSKTPFVKVSPNPVKDFAEFQISDFVAEYVEVRLFNLQGKLVRRAEFSGRNGRVDLSGLPGGVYLYELQGKGWRVSGKMVCIGS